MYKRDEAFSMAIHDPDLIDTSKLITMENINDKLLLVFKETSTYKLITADSTDPERTQLNTAHTYEKVAVFGASSPYVARLFLQFKRIIDLAFSEGSIKPKLLEQIWSLNEQLLVCAQLDFNIREQLDDVAARCDLLIEQTKSSGAIPPIPKVNNLDNDAKTFLSVGKQFLIDCFRLIGLFTGLPINSRNDAHFDNHLKWLQQNCSSNDQLLTTLANDLPWIRRLAECRNAVEHAAPGQTITIENTRLHPGNKFSLPTWSYDLSNKLNLKESDIPIHQELDAYLNNMLYGLEDILISCISESLREQDMYAIYQHADADIDPKCPIKYYAGLTPKLYSKIKQV
ncbi:hypothetical protein C5I_0135895 [Pseudomonas syringae pv. syringae FF5]|nr:hypothetical protein C5I_0135895 [Pseudomonas syringae pv. syringae FF5]